MSLVIQMILTSTYKVLHLEDNEIDASIIKESLAEHQLNFDFRLVGSKAEFFGALKEEQFDLILADYSLPDCNAFDILDEFKCNYPNVPFILVSGTVGEDVAIDSLQSGATDYVLKTKLERLVPAVERALQDLSKRKKLLEAQQFIEDQQYKFQSVFGTAMDAILLLDGNGNLNLINTAAEELFQVKNEEVFEESISLLIPVIFDLEQVRSLSILGEAKNKKRAILYGEKKDGNMFPLEASISRFPFKDREFFVVMVRDITQRQKGEELLLEQMRLNDQILNSTSEGFFLMKSNGEIDRVNPAFCQMSAFFEEEIVKQNFSILIPEEKSTELNSLFELLKIKESLQIETILLNKEGERFYADISFTKMLLDGETWIAGLVRDITSRIQAAHQLNEINYQLEDKVEERTTALKRSNKQLENFAHVVSHDLKEPLRMVNSYVQLLEQKLKDKLTQEEKEYMGFVMEGAGRMNTLLTDVLNYSTFTINTGHNEHLETSLDDVLLVVLSNLKIQIELAGAVVEIPQLPVIHADKTQMIQLFQNLISNGIKFCLEEKPQIKISFKETEKTVIISVADNGIGIDMQYKDRVFGFLQRLNARSEFQGSGIGLSVCKDIVSRHGGKIWFESEKGKGTTFYFILNK